MTDKELTNKELIEQLQALGIQDINPNATKAQLQAMLDSAPGGKDSKIDLQEMPEELAKTASDIEQIMAAIGGVAKSVETLNQRINKIEDGGKNDFKNEMSQDDVDTANNSKKTINPKVVQIVEETLGIDFGIEMEANKNNPGWNFTVLVPKRLSPIPQSTRPVIDKDTGSYSKDKFENVIEETYWPGDRRSRAVGDADSFDMIREHCNRVRAHIVTYYEKLKKPLPEFKLKG